MPIERQLECALSHMRKLSAQCLSCCSQTSYMLSRGEKALLREKKGLAAQYEIFAILFAYNQRSYVLHIYVQDASLSELILKLLREAGVAYPARCVSQGPWQVYSHGPYHRFDYMVAGPDTAPRVSSSPVMIDLTAVSHAQGVDVDLTAE